MSVDEALHRLRQLRAQRSIWTTRVTLVITDTEMMVFDAETNAVMEQFPLSLVYRPTAVTSGDAGDHTDNVVVLVVLGDSQQELPPEIHIFQCLKHRVSSPASSVGYCLALVCWC